MTLEDLPFSFLEYKMLSELRTEITNLFSLYPNQKLELEAKFGTIENSKFKNEIPFSYFDRLRYQITRTVNPIITKTIDESNESGIRKTTDSETGNVTWMRKEKKWDHDSVEYGIRLTLSTENIIKDTVRNFFPKVLRIKNRWSFL